MMAIAKASGRRAKAIIEASVRHHARWSRKTRAAALARRPPGEQNAVAAFDALPLEDKWQLVDEVVTTRTHELLLAYANAVDVMTGHRRARGRLSHSPEPCVKFLVRRKWKKREAMVSPRRIPSRLLTYGINGGRRSLYAVPTDVEETAARALVRAHGSNISVTMETARARGHVACALRRSSVNGNRLFALSCRHVLSLSQSFPNSSPTGLIVRLNGAPGGTVGVTTGIEGLLRDSSEGRSFDAQLFEVREAEVEALRVALAGLGASDIFREDTLPHRFVVLSPDGPVAATLSGIVRDRPVYMIGPRWISHEVLIESEPDESLHGGDSGSPVVSEDGAVLLGMHIAGTEGGRKALAYMIPASRLFDVRQYSDTDTSETWTLVAVP